MLDFGLKPEGRRARSSSRQLRVHAVASLADGTESFCGSIRRRSMRLPMSASRRAEMACPVRGDGFKLRQEQLPGYSRGVIDTGFPTLVTLDPAPGPSRLKRDDARVDDRGRRRLPDRPLALARARPRMPFVGRTLRAGRHDS